MVALPTLLAAIGAVGIVAAVIGWLVGRGRPGGPAIEQRIRSISAELEKKAQENARASKKALDTAAKRLTDERRRLETIIATSPDGIVTVDRQGIIDSFNEGAVSLTGFVAAEAIGCPVTEMMRHEDVEPFRDFFSGYLRGEGVALLGGTFECIGKRADGSDLHLRIAVGDIDSVEKPLFVAFVHDRSDEVRRMRELQEANDSLLIGNELRLLRTAFTDRLQGDYEPHELGRIILHFLVEVGDAQVAQLYLMANQNHERMGDSKRFVAIAGFGMANSRAKPHSFVPGEGLCGEVAMSGEAMRVSGVPAAHLQIDSGFSSSDPGHLLIHPILRENKVIAIIEIGSYGPLRDNLKGLLDQSSVNISTALHVSSAHQEVSSLLYQASRQRDLLEKQRKELHETNKTLASQTQKLLADEQALQQQQDELLRTNDALKRESTLALERNDQLEVARTELQQRAREVEQASRYKSEFLANMSHELRTPLNSLLILAQILVENKPGNLSPQQVKFAKIIRGAGNDLLELINDILDLSKVEAGKMELCIASIAPAALAAVLEQSFEQMASERNLDYVIELDGDLPEELHTDSQRVVQVMCNFLSNSFKFTHEGRVTLAIKNLVPQEREIWRQRRGDAAPEAVSLIVTDTGIGMTPEQLKVVFGAFQQADGSTARRYGGTGLGLSISHELTALLEGEILVESEDGGGSSFTMLLPVHHSRRIKPQKVPDTAGTIAIKAKDQKARVERAERRPAKPRATPARTPAPAHIAPRGKATVLVVDDDTRNSFALEHVLSAEGFSVELAHDGRQALKRLFDDSEAPNIDLVLMDMMMPELDGYGATAQIRASDQLPDLPVIALTAQAMPEDRQKCLDAGANDYLTKPIDPDRLMTVIESWL